MELEKSKKVWKLFFPWQDREEEHWLEEMAAQGWLFEKYSFFSYHFKSIEPAGYIYRMDFKNNGDQDLEEYKEIFAQSGWEHVQSTGGWQYLRIPREQFEVDIYSDKASQIERLRRTSLTALSLLSPLLILIVVMDFSEMSQRFIQHNMGFLNYVLPVLIIIMAIGLIVQAIWLLMLSRRINELKEEE